ncbi:MAG: tRNA uridine-5-carboxymethylaminomethyl(34) synthesis GTPase MnmE [Alistipes sp.]
MTGEHDTIVAPATATGGAIAIIRLSGEAAFAICDTLFRGKTTLAAALPNTILYGKILDHERILDDVLVSVFRAPHSYTGENAVEISCHGSRYIVSEMIALLLHAGARMATPGEFTSRAFLAGKLDLAQAEAVADMIASSSRTAHALASTQMRGGYSQALSTLRERLVKLSALLELELDFSEEDVEFADRREIRNTLSEIGTQINSLRHSFALGNAIKAGVTVAIVGEPNVGKSTLLNRLLNEERAMVSEIAGTTRDAIEECVNIDGILFRFIDTAGIHTTTDQLEQMGIERTFASIEQAQIVLQMTDAAHPNVTPLAVRPDQKRFLIVNKIDTQPTTTLPDRSIGLSAKQGVGIDTLQRALCAAVDLEALYQGDVVISNRRHYEALSAAYEALEHALIAIANNTSADLLSEDIRQIIYHIGIITGAITNDEILNTIFSKFCIGK